jgi:hypothetical protein
MKVFATGSIVKPVSDEQHDVEFLQADGLKVAQSQETGSSAFSARSAPAATFIGTVTIIPFMPDGWDAAAGGFPAMNGNVPFLMKDIVLLAVSVYLLRQDVLREMRGARP